MVAVMLAVAYVAFTGFVLARLRMGRGRRGGGGGSPGPSSPPPAPSDFDLWESELDRTSV
jgi:hypothetical protein